MSENVLRLLYLNTALGETGLLPKGAVIDIGGVSGNNFTIGGKGVMLADGSATGPSGTLSITLQQTYDNAESGSLILNPLKDLNIIGTTGDGLSISGSNGDVTITSDLQLDGNINGVNFNQFHNDFLNHVNREVRESHTALQIAVDASNMQVLMSDNVQSDLEIIDEFLGRAGSFKSFVFEEHIGASEWNIYHNKGSSNPSITIFDENGSSFFADEIKIVDENNIVINFVSAQRGKAVILFV